MLMRRKLFSSEWDHCLTLFVYLLRPIVVDNSENAHLHSVPVCMVAKAVRCIKISNLSKYDFLHGVVIDIKYNEQFCWPAIAYQISHSWFEFE